MKIYSILIVALGLLLLAPYGNAQVEHRVEGFAGRPFVFTRAGLEAGGFSRFVFPSARPGGDAANDRVPAFFYPPQGVKPGERRPAVICLHILGGNFELTRMLCALLAARGIGALWFPLPYYAERGGKGRRRPGPEQFCVGLDQAVADTRRAADLLLSLPEVDGRIGVAGISLGGILAAVAAARDERFQRVVLALAGGDLLRIIDGCRECRGVRKWLASLPAKRRQQVRERVAAFDPAGQGERLRKRAAAGRVLMLNAGRDKVVPPACTRLLAAAIGLEGQVQWLPELGHYTAIAALDQLLGRTADFFAADLPVALRTTVEPVSAAGPAARVRTFLQELRQLLVGNIQPGRCAFAELEFAVDVDGQKVEGQVVFARGAEGRFRLQGQVKGVGQFGVGQGDRLWLTAAGDALFKGQGKIAGAGLLAGLAPENQARLGMLSGGLAGITMAPLLLAQLAEFTWEDSKLRQVVLIKAEGKGSGRLAFLPGSKRPGHLRFSVKGCKGQVRFVNWQAGGIALSGFFAPPPRKKEQVVPARELARMVSAALNFALEKIK